MQYFYFRFTDRFFRGKTIRDMKHYPVIGYQLIVIYLELCSLATEEKGILRIPKVGEIPYINSVASDIGESVESVGIAFTYFLNNGLIEKVENENEVVIEIPYVTNNIGSSSTQADKKRLEYRAGKREQLPKPNCVLKEYGLCKKVLLTEGEYLNLTRQFQEIEQLIEEVDLEKAMGKEFEISDYELIKKKAKEKDGR